MSQKTAGLVLIMTAVTSSNLSADRKLVCRLNGPEGYWLGGGGHSTSTQVEAHYPEEDHDCCLPNIPNYSQRIVIVLPALFAIQGDQNIHVQTSGGESAPQYKNKVVNNQGSSVTRFQNYDVLQIKENARNVQLELQCSRSATRIRQLVTMSFSDTRKHRPVCW
jgi:hypothetical protein